MDTKRFAYGKLRRRSLGLNPKPDASGTKKLMKARREKGAGQREEQRKGCRKQNVQ